MLKDQIEVYKTRWRQLQPRERIILSAGIAFLIFFILYAGIWSPMQDKLKRLRSSVPQAQQKLAWMQVNAAQAKRLRARGPAQKQPGSLLTRLEQATVARGLRQNVSKMEPDGTDGIRLIMEEVSFNSLVSLLADLQKRSGLKVESLTLDSSADTPGIVSARLALRGPR